MEPAPSLEAKAQEARGEANGLLKSVIVNWIWLNMHLIFPTPFFGNLSNGTYFYLQYMKIRILNIFHLPNFIVRQMNIISILFNDLRMGYLFIVIHLSDNWNQSKSLSICVIFFNWWVKWKLDDLFFKRHTNFWRDFQGQFISGGIGTLFQNINKLFLINKNLCC